MEFKFNEEKVKTSKIEIEDIGSCCLEATYENTFTHENYYTYLLIKASYGFAYILKYGPLVEGIMPSNLCSLSLLKTEFNQDKIMKTIDSWLNTPNCPKATCKSISIEDFKTLYKDLFESFNNPEGD